MCVCLGKDRSGSRRNRTVARLPISPISPDIFRRVTIFAYWQSTRDTKCFSPLFLETSRQVWQRSAFRYAWTGSSGKSELKVRVHYTTSLFRRGSNNTNDGTTKDVWKYDFSTRGRVTQPGLSVKRVKRHKLSSHLAECNARKLESANVGSRMIFARLVTRVITGFGWTRIIKKTAERRLFSSSLF